LRIFKRYRREFPQCFYKLLKLHQLPLAIGHASLSSDQPSNTAN
jgi:hypothetical protein